MTLTFQPVTRDRFPDLVALFVTSTAEGTGNPARCWCMEWRRERAAWEAGQGDGNREAMRSLIDGGEVPGIIAYAGGEPAGWCSVSPRPQLPTLRERGAFRNFEDGAIWAVVCFYVRPGRQGQGVTTELLKAAVAYAKERGARTVEGYPVDPEAMTDEAMYSSRFMGYASAFRKAGFREEARGPDGRPIMRYRIEAKA